MLKLEGTNFTTGCARYYDESSEPGSREARVHVKVLPEGLEAPILVKLDTGAPWSILDPEVCEAMGIVDAPGEDATIMTWRGRFSGHLKRVRVRLLADNGESLDVEATVFTSPECPPGFLFLGYQGFLERIRFAIDPGHNFFYFGPLG